MPTTGERRKRGGGEGRSERGGERAFGRGRGRGRGGGGREGERRERERERFIRNYLQERERESAPRREGGGEGERERERERGSRRGSKERLLNAVHVPTDTPTGRPVQHKYGQRHDHDKHAHVGWCVRVQTARSCHTRCHPGGQDGDGRRGKDWWDLPDLSRHTHARTVCFFVLCKRHCINRVPGACSASSHACTRFRFRQQRAPCRSATRAHTGFTSPHYLPATDHPFQSLLPTTFVGEGGNDARAHWTRVALLPHPRPPAQPSQGL